VALLSTASWNAATSVDRTTLTFGPTGYEKSLSSCSENSEDVNNDGLPDLLCRFSTGAVASGPETTVLQLRGYDLDGSPFHGSYAVRILSK
jgi:hypothetical protein